MSAVVEETAVATSKFPAVVYDITAERIAELREIEKAHNPAASTKAYEEACKFRHALVKTRTGMDDKRKEMKADSLAWGRLVDSGYKQWETPLLEIQAKIDAKIKAVDNAKEEARKAKEAAERAKIEAEIAAQKAEEKRIADEAAAAAKAEQDRIAAENKATAERLAAQQREIDDSNAKIKAEQAAAQKKIDDALAEIEAEKVRQATAAAELEAKRIAAKAPPAPPVVEPIAEVGPPPTVPAARKPSAKAIDAAAINSVAFALCTIKIPTVSTAKATEFVTQLEHDLSVIVERCREFKA